MPGEGSLLTRLAFRLEFTPTRLANRDALQSFISRNGSHLIDTHRLIS